MVGRYKEVTMRVVHAAALTAAALLLASVASAQGLGDAASREREKRKTTPAKPAKVYTEGDIGGSTPASATPDLPATGGEAAAEGQPAEGQAPAEGEGAAAKPADAATKAADAAANAEEEARAQAEAAWRKRLDQARKAEAVYKDVIDKLQLELNDTTGGFYNPGRASKIELQEETKQKLAETQGQIAALEEEGRRNRYR
jgi:hypothetical protein